jgi:hypothetical protein
VWWHIPVIPALRETEAGGQQFPGQPGLRSKFKASLGYTVILSQKKKKEKEKKKL